MEPTDTTNRQAGIAMVGEDLQRQAKAMKALRDEMYRLAPELPIIRQLDEFIARQKGAACACANLAADFPGPLTAPEVEGFTRMARNPLVFRLFLNGGKFSATVAAMGTPLGSDNKIRFADLGKNQDGKTYGIVGALKKYHTPLEYDGTLSKGRMAEVYGWKVHVRSLDATTPSPADLQALEDAEVYWVEGSVPKFVGFLGDLFVPNGDGREDYQFGGGVVFPKVLSTYRGGENRDSYIEIALPDSARTLSKGYRLDWHAIGPAYERSVVTTG